LKLRIPTAFKPFTEQSVLLLLLCAVVLTLPFFILRNSQVIILYCIAALFIAARHRFSMVSKKQLLLVLPFVALYALHLLSLLYSSNATENGKQLEANLALVSLLPCLALFHKFNKSHFNVLLTMLVLACLLAMVISYVDVYVRLKENNHGLDRLFRYEYSYIYLSARVGIQPNYLALYLLVSMVYLWLRIKKSKNWGARIGIALLIGAFFFFVFHLQSRITIVTLLLFLVVEVGREVFVKKRYGALIVGVVLVVAGVVLVANIPYLKYRFTKGLAIQIESKEQQKDKPNDTGRLVRWKAAWWVVAQHPVLGVGTGDDHDELMKAYQHFGLKEALAEQYNVHNQYLQYALANGLLGMCIFVFCLLQGLRLSTRKSNTVLLAGIIAFALFSVTESNMKRQKGIVWFALLQGLAIAYVPPKRNDTATATLGLTQHN